MHWIWHNAFNITGTIHCGTRLDEWCALLRVLLQTNDIGMIGHFTGAITVFGASSVANVMSSGFEIHQLIILVPGERDGWLEFGRALEASLKENCFPYSLVVHKQIMCDDVGRVKPASTIAPIAQFGKGKLTIVSEDDDSRTTCREGELKNDRHTQ